jgi:Concanavalin A-like lectin/glucanases superfamily
MGLSLNQSGFVDLGSLVITGYPFTMVGWYRVPSVSNLLTLLRIDNTATTSYHAVVYEGHSAGQAAVISKVGTTGAARSTIAMTPGQWQHVVGVFEDHNSRRVYLDGGNMGSGLNSRVFDGANQFRAGNFFSSTAVDVAEIAIFASILPDEEISMLARGCPVLALPSAAALLTYHDGVREINRPGVGPLASSTGSLTVVDHPRVLMSRGGHSLAQPCRTCGPFQIDQESYRTSFSEQGQLSASGVAGSAGQAAVAGIASEGPVLFGEVLC